MNTRKRFVPGTSFAMLLLAGAACSLAANGAPPTDDVSLYASFDEQVRGDVGGGKLQLHTRTDHPQAKGAFVFRRGIAPLAFRIAPKKGLCGGALQCSDVLPRRGRIFFPAKGNLAYEPGGWGGTISLWINTNPDEQLKTSFCDPVQITHKGAHDGGIWIDFPDTKPRDMRMGIFRGLQKDEQPLKESDPRAPLVRLPGVGFKTGQWHHLAICWENFDTGKPNATARLYVDGKLIGQLADRKIPMRWDIEQTGIYVAVNFIGLMDEVAAFKRPLSAGEVAYLHQHPRYLNEWNAENRERKRLAARAKFNMLQEEAGRLVTSQAAAGDETLEKTRRELIELTAADESRPLAERILGLLAQFPPVAKDPPEVPKFPFDAPAARKYQADYAAWAGLPVEVTNRHGVTLRLIPPGTFRMGSPPDEAGHGRGGYDETQHRVRLTRPFYLSRHETTVGQFQSFVGSTQHVTDGERNDGGHAHDELAVWKHRPATQWRKPGYAGPFVLLDTQPVVHVSHNDALAFCKWLDAQSHLDDKLAMRYALPAEAQWEWACRAGAGSRFWWGEDEDATGRRLNVGDKTLKRVHPKWPRVTMPMDDGFAFVAPVASFQANAFGLYDMLGNVWEFCGTRYGPYPKGEAVDPGDLSTSRGFAVRGGGWSNEPGDARCATRNADPPTFCHSNLGFRVALTLPLRKQPDSK